jgi:hypothetical protein
MRRGQSNPLLVGDDTGSSVEGGLTEGGLTVGSVAGVDRLSLLHAGCVPSMSTESLLPLVLVLPVSPVEVDVKVGVELTPDELLLASMVGVLVTYHLLTPSVMRA